MLEFLFNKVAGINASNFVKRRLQPGCFPVNITFQDAYFENVCKWLFCQFLYSSFEVLIAFINTVIAIQVFYKQLHFLFQSRIPMDA